MKENSGSNAKMGIRERNKLDKLERIKQAAADLFTERGFEKATTREIAELADVGLGTLFLYAEDKRDLVFLIYNDELDNITDAAFARVRNNKPLETQLYEAFAVFYRDFYKSIPLSRVLLKELVFFTKGKQAEKFAEGRARTMRFLANVIQNALDRGELASSVDVGLFAEYIFFVYAGAVRWWISAPEPDLLRGLQHLKTLLHHAVNGRHGPATSSKSSARKATKAKKETSTSV